MNDTRRAAVLADIAGPLDAVLPVAAVVDVPVVAIILQGILAGGRMKAIEPRKAPQVIDAAHDLVSAGSPSADPNAMDRWITRYLDPTSPHRLDGADAIWLRAVTLQRNRDRRSALRPAAGCPTRLVLGNEHRKLLAEILMDGAKPSASDHVGRLVEPSHQQKMTKKQNAAKRKAGAAQPAFDL